MSESNINCIPKRGRPRVDVKRKVFSVYATDDEKILIHIFLKLFHQNYLEDDELRTAKKFFNSIKGRWSNV